MTADPQQLSVGAVCDRAYFVSFKEKHAVIDRAYSYNHHR